MGSTTHKSKDQHSIPVNQCDELLARIASGVESAVGLLRAIDQKLTPSDGPRNSRSDDWLTVKQAARSSGSSYTSILRAIHAGRLKASCLNPDALRPTYRIKPEDLAAWLEANGGATGTPPNGSKVKRRIRSRYFGEM